MADTAYICHAWGNTLSITGTMAESLGTINPLRYRGYIYDTEYNLYYLQSRYYDPAIGRFLNADAFASTGQGVLGNNMFAYCNNNPVMYIDPTGECTILDLIRDFYYALLESLAEIIPINRKALTEAQIEFASIVYAEAGGTNIITQKAVSHAINNRVTLGHWTNPKNIHDAISYPGQFDGYCNTKYMAAKAYFETGQIPYDMYNNQLEIAEMNQCMFAITPILNGWESDFTGGVLYFHSLQNANDWYYHDDYEQVYIKSTTAFWWYR